VGYPGEGKQNTEHPPERRLSQQLRDCLSLHGEGLGTTRLLSRQVRIPERVTQSTQWPSQTKGFIVELSRVGGHLDPTT
jgi:hypothetical protein